MVSNVQFTLSSDMYRQLCYNSKMRDCHKPSYIVNPDGKKTYPQIAVANRGLGAVKLPILFGHAQCLEILGQSSDVYEVCLAGIRGRRFIYNRRISGQISRSFYHWMCLSF